MTVEGAPGAASAGTPGEDALVTSVLSTLLREDVVGLRSRGTAHERADGTWLRLGTGDRDALLMPVSAARPGFQCTLEARLPLLRRESDGVDLADIDSIMTVLAGLADPVDRDGFDAFATEWRQALAVLRLHNATRDEVNAQLTDTYGPDPARWTGPAAGLAFDTLAARTDHPVYPTGRSRSCLTEGELRSYAPEFHQRFTLRWLAVPRDRLTVHGEADRLAWPAPSSLGLPPGLDDTHRAIPVHPLTAGGPLRQALADTGHDTHLARTPYLEVLPTLSMRTVALTADPGIHLKLPLATATLGRLNRRTIKSGTLTDGAAVGRLLETVIGRTPRFRDTVLIADESVFVHAGHELLAVLVRRYPAGLGETTVVPMAALLSPSPGGGLIIDRLADRFYSGDPVALLDAALTLLLDWQTTLFGHGIALESHQQNISLLLDRDSGRTRLRLLFKDNDGPRVNAARMRESLGQGAPAQEEFDDTRILTDSDGPALDLFTTITVHLCAGAYAFGLARYGRAPLDDLLSLVRDRLAEACERLGTGPGQPGAVLRAHVLDSTDLPVKAMVTAGTLLSKDRSGASDINKHYSTGPNYLLRGA
ncbi:IucA/IucC family protein [Streptomyces sp. NPDC051098]|uniref:IucA/IucC family protein n=1 Tax=Streptomyces sp. NPDC051098 TaxID=3155411 RepID=UPI00341A231C